MRFEWRRLGFALLLLMMICAVFGYGLFRRGLGQLRDAVGETLVWTANGTMQRLVVPTPWRQALSADIASLSRAVAAGDFPLYPAIRLMRAFERGPVYLTLLLRSFEGIVRPRYANDIARQKDLSVRIGRFFSVWKRLGQPPDVVASVSCRLIVEKEELSSSPSGFSVSEIYPFLRIHWNEERIESMLAFFDGLKADNASTPASSLTTESTDIQMPEPLDELRAEISRLVALGTGKDPTRGNP